MIMYYIYSLIIKDRVKDELIKIKVELNKKNVELNTLRIDFQRLEDDNTKNLRIIQHILNEFGKDISENILNEMGYNQDYNPNNLNNLNEQLNNYFDGTSENDEGNSIFIYNIKLKRKLKTQRTIRKKQMIN
jgi:hypothetical protein